MASCAVLVAVGAFSKFLIHVINRTETHNLDKFREAVEHRPAHVPLITVSNHYSCYDDPGIWGCLGWRLLLSWKKLRWSLAAWDVCFTNKFHSYFFLLGQSVPVVRGLGVHQEAINFVLEQLSGGGWAHVFPEGRVNVEKEYIRFKWGVGRLIYECPVQPIVIPIFHLGMDDILPNKKPYFFRVGKVLTMNFGDPIDVGSILQRVKNDGTSEVEARRLLTEKIQEELTILKEETEILRNKNLKTFFVILQTVNIPVFSRTEKEEDVPAT